MQKLHSRQSEVLTREMLVGREKNLSGIILIKMLLSKFPQGSMLLQNFVKLSLIVKDNVMFQICKPPDSTKRSAHCSEAPCNRMELIVNKYVSVLFDRVALVRMGRLGPQERRERRYDTEIINTEMCSNYGEDEVDYDTINLMSSERNSFSNLANTKPILK